MSTRRRPEESRALSPAAGRTPARRATPSHPFPRPPALMGLPRPLPPIAAVRYVADGSGKIRRIIPLLDYPEVIKDQQRGAARPVRQNERRFRLLPGQRHRPGGAHTEPGPLRDWPAALRPGQAFVEIARQDDLAAPALVAAPAEPRDVVGDRAQDIRPVVPDVAVTIAVEIDGVAEEGRRHELALAHRAGPGTEHRIGSHVALVEDLQRRDQLGAEHRAAPALECEGGERRRHEVVAHGLAEVALDTP